MSRPKKTAKTKSSIVNKIDKKDIDKVLGECNDTCVRLLMKDGTRRIVEKSEIDLE